MRRLLGCVVLALCLCAPAGAQTYPQLDALASYWAQRPVTVECPTPQEWADDYFAAGAWGYVFLGEDVAHIDPFLCDAAMAVARGDLSSEPLWAEGMAILVITHESWHLRDWAWNFNEARVECAAIKHFPESYLLLSRWDTAHFWDLAPYALAGHYGIAAAFSEYNMGRKCKLGWWPPWR